MITVKRGLNLPITGTPEQQITDAKQPETVAVLGPDYVGMKPTMMVRVADNVKVQVARSAVAGLQQEPP